MIVFCALFFTSLFTIFSRSVAAQTINCSAGAFFCSWTGEGTCAAPYSFPDGCTSPENCCNTQSIDTCQNMACQPPANVDPCDVGYTCNAYNSEVCEAGGGTYGDCQGNGYIGTCCFPENTPPPAADPCPNGDVCYSIDPSMCTGSLGGYPAPNGTCAIPGGGTGNCCVPDTLPPPENCPVNTVCEYMTQTQCDSQWGSSVWIGSNPGCYISSTQRGNCCVENPPAGYGVNTYMCDYGPGYCVPLQSSAYPSPPDPQYGCQPGFLTCEQAIEASGNPSLCNPCSTGSSFCSNEVRNCVQDPENPPVGYWCAGASTGCMPCYDWSTNIECQPGSYYSNITACQMDVGSSCYTGGTSNLCFPECEQSLNGSCDYRCLEGYGCKNFCVQSGSSCPDSNDIVICTDPDMGGSCFCATPAVNDPGAPGSGPGDPFVDVWGKYAGLINLSVSESAALIYNVLFPIGILLGIGAVIFAGYIYMTSQGRPDRLKIGGEQLTAGIFGTLFIVLSIVILRVIIKTLIDPSADL